MSAILRMILLPQVVSDFEQNYLARMNKIATGFFVAHLPIFVLIAWANDTGPALAFALTAITLMGPLVAMRFMQSKRQISTVMGITAMFMGGLLVHFGQGPVQIEMHFYFFVLLALLAVFANPMVIVAAAVTAALHHAILWVCLPSSVFNYDAPFWVVGVHALFVLLESVAACFIARSFFDNVIGLEKKVAERTEELQSRNRDMRMLLDAVGQGFFTVDQHGIISEERSNAVDRMLGAPDPQMTFADLIRRHDANAADWIELGLTDVFLGIMPVEVTIDQLPSRFTSKNHTFAIDYSPVMQGDEATAVAVVISDITSLVEREKLEAEHREIMVMLERVTADKTNFLDFVRESDALMAQLRSENRTDLVTIKRNVHTLKGNCGIYGLERMAQACHRIESHIAEHATLPEASEWTALQGIWSSVKSNLQRILGEANDQLDVPKSEYEGMLDDILRSRSRDDLAIRMASWKLEPTSRRMKVIAEQARQLAVRLGKGNIFVRTHGGHLRIDPKHWGEFWAAFVHVVRNAVDHGLESPEDRRVKGKCEVGQLRMETRVDGDTFSISLSDDGRGVNWDKVADVASKHGLPVDSNQDLIDALFQDGVSTTDCVSEVSGRGVGMAAVREACEKLNGHITVESERGQGTTVRFQFPVAEMAPEPIRMLIHNEIADAERVVFRAPTETPHQESSSKLTTCS
ncbi:MAG: Hpt domain-containing protein [Planctomycetales bacterium]|nr:Hpt domain-containing protein [Planctomycetales bacterium]